MVETLPDANPKTAFGMTKPPMHLLPSTALVRTAMVMKLGAAKYGAYNWREAGVAATVYVSAAERHLRSWLDGEDNDAESTQSHLAHMVACGLILLDAMEIGKLIDDRPPAAPTAELIADLTTPMAPAKQPPMCDDKWKDHDGTRRPSELTDDDEVKVLYRDLTNGSGSAVSFAWIHEGQKGDILRWRYTY